MGAVINYNDYYHTKRIIKEPGSDNTRFQDPSSKLDEAEEANDMDYENPCKVGKHSMEEDFRKKNKNIPN